MGNNACKDCKIEISPLSRKSHKCGGVIYKYKSTGWPTEAYDKKHTNAWPDWYTETDVTPFIGGGMVFPPHSRCCKCAKEKKGWTGFEKEACRQCKARAVGREAGLGARLGSASGA